MRRTFMPLILAALATIPGVALAHASLTGSTPAANSTVAAPARIVLRFNERLIGSTVKTEVAMTGMPGMTDHAPMPIALTAQMARDGKSMTLTPKRALPRGTYRVTWSAAGADTHRMGSNFSFTVR
jgi:methionine-rich copper-binding protein CopC